ncbi:hypothetical protein SISSUDRAFT_487422 [Sistotremastrum suecicum HHB10207 ss-3]|uniref:Uncharacterized protein n=1 Tax=Sistotremastrum suecicum HHB10207 ss-3 TaxID=1314776 RepID=A0A165Y1D0_9AGAM|nr:hypothetical protein SISSUDRAFT_487422 [Sistotremastrum suecicum HHB10207 ss-3]
MGLLLPISRNNHIHAIHRYEYNGRTLKVHHDKFTPSLALSMSSPGRSSFPSSPLDHIPSPFQLAHGSGHRPSPLSNVVQPDHSHYAGSYSFGPPSGPPTPYDHPLSAPPPMSPQRSLPPPSGPLHNQPAQALSSSVSPSRPSFADKAPAPLNLSGRSTSNSTGSSSKEQSGAHSSSTSPKNNFHPGPIALPPLRGNQISQAASGVSVSPLHHPAYSPHMGLPPITPSMPSFSFMPQNSTPQLHREFLSPGIGPYSPPLVDGGFWGRTPGAWVNPAPGAPLHAHSPMDSPANAPHDPAYSANMRRVNTEPGDYFPPVMPQEPPDYFPPMPPEQRDTGDDETSTATSHRGRPGSGFSDRSSDLGLGGPGKTSSIATSFDDAQELERRASGDGSKSDPKHTSPASLEVTGRTYSDGAPKPRSSTPAVSTPSKTDQQHIQGWDGTSTDLTFNHNQEFAKALGMPYGRRASWTPGTEKPPSLPQKNSDPVL